MCSRNVLSGWSPTLLTLGLLQVCPSSVHNGGKHRWSSLSQKRVIFLTVASSGTLSGLSFAAGHSETDRCGRRDQCRRSPTRNEAEDQTICAHYSTQVFPCLA